MPDFYECVNHPFRFTLGLWPIDPIEFLTDITCTVVLTKTCILPQASVLQIVRLEARASIARLLNLSCLSAIVAIFILMVMEH